MVAKTEIMVMDRKIHKFILNISLVLRLRFLYHVESCFIFTGF
jgi:hypothetical protein